MCCPMEEWTLQHGEVIHTLVQSLLETWIIKLTGSDERGLIPSYCDVWST